jgi:hypothetical protein
MRGAASEIGRTIRQAIKEWGATWRLCVLILALGGMTVLPHVIR